MFWGHFTKAPGTKLRPKEVQDLATALTGAAALVMSFFPYCLVRKSQKISVFFLVIFGSRYMYIYIYNIYIYTYVNNIPHITHLDVRRTRLVHLLGICPGDTTAAAGDLWTRSSGCAQNRAHHQHCRGAMSSMTHYSSGRGSKCLLWKFGRVEDLLIF